MVSREEFDIWGYFCISRYSSLPDTLVKNILISTMMEEQDERRSLS